MKDILDLTPTQIRILYFASKEKIGLVELTKKIGIALNGLLDYIKKFEKEGIAKKRRFGKGRKVYLEINEGFIINKENINNVFDKLIKKFTLGEINIKIRPTKFKR